VQDGGTVIAYSSLTGDAPSLPLGDLIFRQLSLRGFAISGWVGGAPKAEIEATYALLGSLLESGELNTSIDETFALQDYRQALARARQGGRGGKVLFTPNMTQ
jgi:NADPH:quinone reductase-like Zn-dependent oxidoreductase